MVMIRRTTPQPRSKVTELPDGPEASDGLTPRQRLVIECIRTCLNKRGYPPSIREIGEAVGLTSPSSVYYQLQALENKGFIRRDPNRPRALELVTPDDQIPADSSLPHDIPAPVNVPVVGHIAAGTPILADQYIEQTMPLPRDLVGNGTLFILEVHGDSMIDAAICNGDYVVVRQQPTADNGDIVAAMTDDEATVKTLAKRDGHTWLMPRNPNYEPILGDQATIVGKVVAVLRRV